MAAKRLGLPEKLSPSRLKDFKQCPRLFYYKSVLGMSTPPTEATARGTIAHYAFEHIFNHPRDERTPQLALEYVEPAWDLMCSPYVAEDSVPEGTASRRLREVEGAFVESAPAQEDRARKEEAARQYREIIPEGSDAERRVLEGAAEAVRGWFAMENPQKFDPSGRERYVTGKLGGALVHGFIDRLDDVEAKGARYVSDYKTGKKPAPRFEEETFFQLDVYALLLEEMGEQRPDYLRLIYVSESAPTGVLQREVTAQRRANSKKQVTAVVKAILEADSSGNWQPRKQKLCGWCYFQNVCPAFNPELEGMLPEEIEYKALRAAAGTVRKPRKDTKGATLPL